MDVEKRRTLVTATGAGVCVGFFAMMQSVLQIEEVQRAWWRDGFLVFVYAGLAASALACLWVLINHQPVKESIARLSKAARRSMLNRDVTFHRIEAMLETASAKDRLAKKSFDHVADDLAHLPRILWRYAEQDFIRHEKRDVATEGILRTSLGQIQRIFEKLCDKCVCSIKMIDADSAIGPCFRCLHAPYLPGGIADFDERFRTIKQDECFAGQVLASGEMVFRCNLWEPNQQDLPYSADTRAMMKDAGVMGLVQAPIKFYNRNNDAFDTKFVFNVFFFESDVFPDSLDSRRLLLFLTESIGMAAQSILTHGDFRRTMTDQSEDGEEYA